MDLKDFIGVMGMTEIISGVKDVRKDVAKTGKPFYKVSLDNGQLLFAWSFDKIKNIKKGEKARFLVDQSKTGNFLYISAAELVGADDVEPWDEPAEETSVEDEKGLEETARELPEATTPNPPVTKEEYWAQRDASIGRMAALNTAVGYLTYCAEFKGTHVSRPVTEEEVVEIAKRFESYAKTGN